MVRLVNCVGIAAISALVGLGIGYGFRADYGYRNNILTKVEYQQGLESAVELAESMGDSLDNSNLFNQSIMIGHRIAIRDFLLENSSEY